MCNIFDMDSFIQIGFEKFDPESSISILDLTLRTEYKKKITFSLAAGLGIQDCVRLDQARRQQSDSHHGEVRRPARGRGL